MADWGIYGGAGFIGQHRLLNAVSDENLTFNAYGVVLRQLEGYQKRPLQVPEKLLKLAAFMMKPLGWVLGAGSKFHPVRMSKLTRALTPPRRPDEEER